jgi:Mrp family chromosome partitioning ATPase
MDAAILVVEANSTRRGVVKRAVNTLKESKCKLLGTVLNQVDEDLPRYSYKGYGY